MTNRKQTRVQRIIAAQKTVEDWSDTLSRMTADDLRFAGCLEAYEAAIEARSLEEAA
jgi:hypothetical protein